MEIVNSQNEDFGNIICLKKGHEKLFVLKDEIIMFSTNERKVDVYTIISKYTINATLNEIEKKLKDPCFFRANQSCLINLKMVKKIINRGRKRYIEFYYTTETAILSKVNEQKLYEMIKII